MGRRSQRPELVLARRHGFVTLPAVPKLEGKTVVLTGGNSGIGERTAVGLAKMGARVLFTSRSADKGEKALARIREESGNDSLECLHLDLAELASVNRFADEVLEKCPSLDVLICNAGLYLTERFETKDGFEMTFGVNHLGHFHLVARLRERLVESAPSRVVVLSSGAHQGAAGGLNFDDLHGKKRFFGWQAYCRSKLANILFTRELARRLEGTGVTANSVHPGLVDSGFGGDGDAGFVMKGLLDVARPFMRSAEQGAETPIYLASSPDVEGKTGGYYIRNKLRRPAIWGRNDDAAKRLWDVSEKMIADALAQTG